MEIPPQLYLDLRQVLLRCDIFKSDSDLKTLFVVQPLNHWEQIILDAGSHAQRVDHTIYTLANRYSSEGENVFILFLRILRDRLIKTGALYQQLGLLIDELVKLPTPDFTREIEVFTDVDKKRAIIVAISSGPKPIPGESAIDYHLGQGGLSNCWLIVGPGDDSEMSSPSNAKRIRKDLVAQGIQVDSWVLRDVDDIKRVFEIVPAIVQEARLKYDLQPDEIIADYTGGTKSLTAGMVLGAIATGIKLQYLKPNEYLPDGRTDRKAGSSPRQVNITFANVQKRY